MHVYLRNCCPARARRSARSKTFRWHHPKGTVPSPRALHAACHAAINLMFRSCTALSSSSPVIETCHFRGRESVSDSISAIEAPASMCMIWLCTHYIDDLLPYAPLELCSYWVCGQVFIDNFIAMTTPLQYIKKVILYYFVIGIQEFDTTKFFALHGML